jgi:hypothetical protein
MSHATEEGLTSPRDQFAALVAELDGMSGDWLSVLVVQMRMDDEILTRIHQVKPKAKTNLPPAPSPGVLSLENIRANSERWDKLRALAYKILGEDELRSIVERYKGLVQEAQDERDHRRGEIKARLSSLAVELVPQPGSTWTKVAEIGESTFSSQTDASGYARTSAEVRALSYAVAGLEVEVRHRRRVLEIPHPKVYRTASYEVWVQADPLDVDIVKFGHGLSTAEWLQQVVARGMNPRVFSPGLPWGLEERLGIKQGSAELRSVRVVEATELGPE